MSGCTIAVESGRYSHDEAIDFLSKAFGPDYFSARYYKTRLFAAEPSGWPENFLSARDDDGRLVGMLRIVARDLLVDGVPLRTGFLTSVAVHPARRDEGIGADLVRRALDVLQTRGFDLAGVHGRRAVDGFYPKFGFVNVGRYVDLEIISRIDPTENIDVMPLEPGDLPMAMHHYQDTYNRLAGSVRRDAGVWRFLLEKSDLSNGVVRLLRLERDKKPMGYIATMGEDLIEATAEEKCIPLLPGILKRLGLKRMRLHPRHPLFTHCRQQYSTVRHERFALDGGYMARLLNTGAILQKLVHRLTARTAMCAVTGSQLSLLGFDVDPVSGLVCESRRPSDIDFDNEDYAAQMVLGFQSLQCIPGAQVGSDNALPGMMFPPLDFHSATLDEV